MFNLVEKRRWYFLFSALIIIPGLLIMLYSTITTGAPFSLSIDFVGGSIYDLTFEQGGVTETAIREVFASVGDDNVVIQQLGKEDARWSMTNVAAESADTEATVASMNSAFAASTIGGTLTARYDERNSRYLLTFSNQAVTEEQLRAAFASLIGEATTIGAQTTTRWSVRASYQENAVISQIESRLNEIAPLDSSSFGLETVSATVGQEVTRMAIFAVIAGSLVITTFIVIAFRQVPNAFRYGASAIAAMVHDILVVMGVMSLMGLLFGWEVDALFLTALLTVVGFSVQDSIVVFDRIRENIPLRLGEPYETIVNRSLWETIHRSLATQLNAFFIMAAILLFGGDTLRQFIFMLFIGLLTGSYSSLFTAVPMLVSWEKGEIPFLNQESKLQEA